MTPKAAINMPHYHPVSPFTRSYTPSNYSHMIRPRKVASRFYPKALLAMLAMLVIYEETGHILSYRQLRTHPRFAHMWDQSYSNEIGRLCQGVGTVVDFIGKRVYGTNTFHVIH